MTVTDQIKIFDRKIMQNETQYDLDRKAVKISALSSNDLDKCEYLTGEDLGLKPSGIEQNKFEYSPLGKTFNKELSEDDKKEGLFKRLENVKDINLTQLQAIKDQWEQHKRELKNIDKSRTLKAITEIGRKNDEANKILLNGKKRDAKIDTEELVCTKTEGTKYDFNRFAFPLKFIEKTYNYEITLDEAKDNQDKLEKLTIRLENYKARINKKKEEKNKEEIKEKTKEEAKEEIERFISNGIALVERESKDINNDLFQKHFDFSTPIDLGKKLVEKKEKKENSELVEKIKNIWSNLKDETEKMSKEEIKTEKANEILGIVNEIIDFNKEIQKQ